MIDPNICKDCLVVSSCSQLCEKFEKALDKEFDKAIDYTEDEIVTMVEELEACIICGNETAIDCEWGASREEFITTYCSRCHTLYSKEDKAMMDSPDNYLKLIIKDEHTVDEDDDLYVKYEMTFKEALASWKRSRILNKEF